MQPCPAVGVRPNHDLQAAARQLVQQSRALVTATLAQQQSRFEPCGAAEGGDAHPVLAGEYLGRRHQRCLTAGLDRAQHRHQRDQGLAAADIALKQAQHATVAFHVAIDLGDRLDLRVRELMPERRQCPGAQRAIAAIGTAGRRRCDSRRTAMASWLARISSYARRRRASEAAFRSMSLAG